MDSISGQPAKLGRPVDWLVIADHSDGMGFIADLAEGKPGIVAFEQGKRWYGGLQQGGDASAAATLGLIGTFEQGQMDPGMMAEYSPGGETYSSIREDVVDTDPNQSAFHYARVLENPTPRWVVHDAFRFGVEIPEEAQTTHQERAYTSPIRYTPGKG